MAHATLSTFLLLDQVVLMLRIHRGGLLLIDETFLLLVLCTVWAAAALNLALCILAATARYNHGLVY